jgi:organic radical activating enzyme
MHFLAGQEAETHANIPAALEQYRAALGLDPGHVGAIAAYGRLRFKEPATPYLDDLREQLGTKVISVVVQVRNPCNFRCFYCLGKGHNAEPVQQFDFTRMENFFAQIGATPNSLIITNLECGGGEPTVHPQFPQLVELGSRYGAFTFPTNNSQDPKRWLPKEKASQIAVNATLHPEGEDNIERFISYARYIIDAGARFNAGFIAHPTRIAKIPEYRELFAKHDIPFYPVSYIGEYEGRAYPAAHSEEEKKIMGFSGSTSAALMSTAIDEKNTDVMPEAPNWMHRIDPHVSKNRNFRGVPCLAGYQSFYLSNQGSLQRCYFDKRAIEAPLQKAEPCVMKNCACGLMLEKLNQNDTGDLYNSGAQLAGKNYPPFDAETLAKKHGYASASDATLKEQTSMYNTLMEAYGKNEFFEHPCKQD